MNRRDLLSKTSISEGSAVVVPKGAPLPGSALLPYRHAGEMGVEQQRLLDHALEARAKMENTYDPGVQQQSLEAVNRDYNATKREAKQRRYRKLDMDDTIDVAGANARGETPRLHAMHNEVAERYGPEQVIEYREVNRSINLDMTMTEEQPGDIERVHGLVEKYRRTNLAQGLLYEYPKLKSTLDEAKTFSFGQDATEKLVELSKEDWRRWLPRALNPFPVTLFQFDSDHFRIDLKRDYAEGKTDDALALTGVTGALLVGGYIIPLHKMMDRAYPMLAYAYLPSLGARIAAGRSMFVDGVNSDGGPIDVMEGLWSDTVYRDAYGMPPDLELYFLPEGAMAATRWERINKQLSIWSMHIALGAVRRALAACALLNAERPVVELGPAGGRDGRTIQGGKSVPRYTMGTIRIRPDAPEVRRERDPDAEPTGIVKALHDVRAHSRTYHRGTDKEFTIDVESHERGDKTKGDLRKLRAYAVGATASPVVIQTSGPTTPPPAEEAPVGPRYDPAEGERDPVTGGRLPIGEQPEYYNEETDDHPAYASQLRDARREDKQLMAALVLASVPRVQIRKFI